MTKTILGVRTAFQDANADIKQGFLYKQSRGASFFKNWRKRYCVLEQGIFSYYEHKSDEYPYGTGLKGTMTLKKAIIAETSTKGKESSKILIKSGLFEQEDLILDAETPENAEQWVKAIIKHIDFANGKYTFYHKKQQENDDEYSITSIVPITIEEDLTPSESWQTRNTREASVSSKSSKCTITSDISIGSWNKIYSREKSLSIQSDKVNQTHRTIQFTNTTGSSNLYNSTKSNQHVSSSVKEVTPRTTTISMNPTSTATISPRFTPPTQPPPPPPQQHQQPPPVTTAHRFSHSTISSALSNISSPSNISETSNNARYSQSSCKHHAICQVCFMDISEDDINKFKLFNGYYHSQCVECIEPKKCNCRQSSHYFKYAKVNCREDKSITYCGHFVDYICAEAIQKVFRGFKSRKIYSKSRLLALSK